MASTTSPGKAARTLEIRLYDGVVPTRIRLVMKFIASILAFVFVCNLAAKEPRVVPADPPLATFTEKAKVSGVIVLLAIDRTTKPATYRIQEILHGKAEYGRFKDTIDRILPKPPDKQSLLPDFEIVFVRIGGSPTAVRGASTYTVYPARTESDGNGDFFFQTHSIDAVKSAIADGVRQARQKASVQPATVPGQK